MLIDKFYVDVLKAVKNNKKEVVTTGLVVAGNVVGIMIGIAGALLVAKRMEDSQFSDEPASEDLQEVSEDDIQTSEE